MDLCSVSADNMRPSIPPHPHRLTPQETPKDSSANLEPETLDLSKKRLQCLSDDLYRDHPAIKSMHLEGNTLCSLPENFFLHLPHLVWLDLRNNQIKSLPSTIGKHRQLQYLLLEGNPIKMLPIALGDLSTLKALNLRHCPLEFPPEEIVYKGLASILSFLRSFKKEEDPESIVSELPPVEKLNLKELRSSMDLSGDWSSSEEKKHFEMLKHKIEEKQMEEMDQSELLTCHRKPQNTRDPVKGTGWKFFTESRPAMLVERRKSEADRQAEEKERLAMVLQKQRNEKILKDWQQQTKLMQDHKARSKTKTKNHEVQVPAPPYATDLDTSQHKNSWDKQKSLAGEKQEMMPRVMSVNLLKEAQKARASRDLRLEHRIKQHIQSMQERRKKPKRSAQEEMEAARKELEVASLLQAEMLQRKREQDAAMEYRFTAFTGDISTQSTGGPQNICATTL
ncbi:leucine-rich repeat-containing protein 27 [Hyla sarda]|uniref:leucine-rich repeat-containing protein 27 n=1 Tax=Hyla sarda TaxID=327740 RepID=UPI0024C44E3A|nr:leucine-rich repeat-containing protein 27 [Hyla sarda]XP_056385825.1 leucine-rich repeat-containing protein 27 [Hyla sarda]XP_056385826.1 leucine-rich repeat-containing protein 27 [Hyla sarda]